MNTILKPARAVKPGDILREELEERGWTQKDFAQIIGRPVQAVNEIIGGKKSITPETAMLFAAAFSTSPEIWLNLENSYRLAQFSSDSRKDEVARRAAEMATPKKREIVRKPSVFHFDVLVERQEEQYFAYCLQLDLVAAAPNESEVTRNIMEMISSHLNHAAARENALRPAPLDVWLKLWRIYQSPSPRCRVHHIDSDALICEAVVCYA